MSYLLHSTREATSHPPHTTRVRKTLSAPRIVASGSGGHCLGILESPLIARKNTEKNISELDAKNSTIYFGTGVVTPKAISQGIPFDFMGMLLSAEWVRRQTGATHILHEISDSHAQASGFHDGNKVRKIAYYQQTFFTQLAHDLGLSNSYKCILASSYRETDLFKKIQADVDSVSLPETPLYARYQSAGNLYVARHENVRCKIGWLTEDKENPTGLDERYFNDTYSNLGLLPLSFIYTWCGWNFDQSRTRVSPYTSVQGENRLMLDSERPSFCELDHLISSCQNKKIVSAVIQHLARIVTAYGALFNLPTDNIWENTPTPKTAIINIKEKDSWAKSRYIDLHELANCIDIIRNPSRKKENRMSVAA